MRRSQSGKSTVRLVHVDTSQLDLDHEFELSRVKPPDDGNSGETIYKVKPSEKPSQNTEVILIKKIEGKTKTKSYRLRRNQAISVCTRISL